MVVVAAGESFSLAVTAEGRLFSFGGGQYGRLGLGDENDQLLPVVLEDWNMKAEFHYKMNSHNRDSGRTVVIDTVRHLHELPDVAFRLPFIRDSPTLALSLIRRE